MHSDPAAAPLRDILYHIDLATSFAAELDSAAFHVDLRTIFAVTRCLEIISEASRGVPPEVKARHPGIPWAEIAGAGNVYRHDYEDVQQRLVWGTVYNRLHALLEAVELELRRFDAQP